MHVKQPVDRDRLRGAEAVDGPRHRVDVPEDFVGSDVDVGLPGHACRFGAQQPAATHHKALDERRGDRLRAEQQASERLGVREGGGSRVEGRDGPLGVGDVRCHAAVEAKRPTDERVGHVRFVLAALAVLARQATVQARLPASAQNLAHVRSLFKEGV